MRDRPEKKRTGNVFVSTGKFFGWIDRQDTVHFGIGALRSLIRHYIVVDQTRMRPEKPSVTFLCDDTYLAVNKIQLVKVFSQGHIMCPR